MRLSFAAADLTRPTTHAAAASIRVLLWKEASTLVGVVVALVLAVVL